MSFNPRRLVVTLAALLLTAPSALAAAGGGPVPDQGPPPLPGGGLGEVDWTRLVGGTVVVIVLICAGVWLLKRLGGAALLGKGHYMQVLEARPVGRNLQLLLVRIGGRVVLLGATGETVTRLGEFDEDELPVPEAKARPSGEAGFGALVAKLAGVES